MKGAFTTLRRPGREAPEARLVVAVERTNLRRRMPVQQYAVDFRRSLARVDPMPPVLGSMSGPGALLFALNSTGRAAALTWVAVALFGVIIVSSLIVAERTLLGIAAFTCAVGAVA